MGASPIVAAGGATSARRLMGPLVIVWLALLLAACGFHLRGSDGQTLPFKSAFVTGAANDATLVARLQDALVRGGVGLTSAQDQAEVVIALGDVRTESRVLTVGSSSGDIEEYELHYAVAVAFRRGSGEVLQSSSTVEFANDYSYDKTSVLAKEEERTMLTGDMRAAAVREILRRAGRLTIAAP